MAAQVAIAVNRKAEQVYPSIQDNLCHIHSFIKKSCVHRWLHYLCGAKNNIYASERLAILMNLRDFYREHQSRIELNHCNQLAEICQYLCDWKLLITVAQQGLVLQPNNVQLRCYLMQACWHLGDHQGAIALATRYVLDAPVQNIFYDYYQRISAWQRFSKVKKFTPSSLLQGKHIYLQPLGHQHVNDFAWQYADPRIAALCCLPLYQGGNQWHEWLAEDMEDSRRATYAVMHPEWGFIGIACLIRYRELGLFYYWLGEDFQGHGFGPDAVEMLLDHDFAYKDMKVCYAKVYEYNIPSIKAITKMGFIPLSVTAKFPFDQELFFYKGTVADEDYLQQGFIDLMDFLGIDIQIINSKKITTLSGE
jgi:RimJ/RimL family protein N-acetyltransferase